MGLDSATLPDHIKRLMPVKERRAMGRAGMTTEEAVAALDAKSERELQDQILAYLRQRDIVPFYSRMDRKTSNVKGQPDFLFAYHGVPVAWEVKTPTGKLSPEQEAIIPKLTANGWRHAVIRSLPQAKGFLDALPRGEGHGRSKLTEIDISAIRGISASTGASQRNIARMFGVSQPLIGKIIRKELWTHL